MYVGVSVRLSYTQDILEAKAWATSFSEYSEACNCSGDLVNETASKRSVTYQFPFGSLLSES